MTAAVKRGNCCDRLISPKNNFDGGAVNLVLHILRTFTILLPYFSAVNSSPVDTFQHQGKMSKSTASYTVKAYVTPVWTSTFKRCRARQSSPSAATSSLRALRGVATRTPIANPVNNYRCMSASAVQAIAPETESVEVSTDELAPHSVQQLDSQHAHEQDVQALQVRSDKTTNTSVFPLYR